MSTFFKFVLLFSLFTSVCKSQIFVRAYHYRPTGGYGYVFKPGFSAEIGYMPEFEKRVRFCASATYAIMKPRAESFPIYAVKNSGGSTVLPGTFSYKKYNVLNLFAGIDVAIIKKEKFFAYLGTDVFLGTASVNYNYDVAQYKTMGYSGGGYLIGLRVRLGAQYDVTEKIGIIAHINRLGFKVTEPSSTNWLNDYGIGIRYQLF
jgi:hypothetical protein